MGNSSSKRSSGSSSSWAVQRFHANEAARRHHKSDFQDPDELEPHLEPGDLLQEKGKWFYQWFYSHWAVYIGRGEIVHVQKVKCRSGKVKIVREKLTIAFADCDVRKNNHMDDEWRDLLHRENNYRTKIVLRARGYVGDTWDYNLITNNCEHFATLCRYERKISLQSFGIGDLWTGNVTLSEYMYYHGKSIKEKCHTFWSWIKRKVTTGIDSAIEGVRRLAIDY